MPAFRSRTTLGALIVAVLVSSPRRLAQRSGGAALLYGLERGPHVQPLA
jgi:hypothetical protein